jgi:hypothetical protein
MCATPAQQPRHPHGIWIGGLKNILTSKCEGDRGVKHLRKLQNFRPCVRATGAAENRDALALCDQIGNAVQIAIGRPYA